MELSYSPKHESSRFSGAIRCMLFIVIFLSGLSSPAQVVRVEVKKNASGEFRLYRDGAEYYVKGGGGSEEWEELARIGGNSVRTWNYDNAKELLDKAQDLGLTVMMGLWMQHERHGFDYDDEAKVKAQLEQFRKVVLDIKDHPALLLWGVGNEVDLQYTNTNVWKAVNDIAIMIHELDPNHPTCTVTAGLDGDEVKYIMKDAPAIDIYGINTYGDISNVRKNILKYGWSGPYLITEWGPNGHWEVQKTKWGAPIEPSSSEKKQMYMQRYQEDILGDPIHCMGSYVFLWGNKQETTATWYGLFTVNGKRTEPVDVLEAAWSSKPLSNSSPSLKSLKINSKESSSSVLLNAGTRCEALAEVFDQDNDKLVATWSLIPESTDIRSGGDAESAPMPMTGVLRNKKLNSVQFIVPDKEGAYRLFYEVTDGNNHVAYGNFPFYVVPALPDAKPAQFVRFKQQEMQ